jgi:subtilase family serine protease
MHAGWAYETNENNNVKASPIMLFESPHPDVSASVWNVPDTVTAGVAFNIQYHLANAGEHTGYSNHNR